MHVVWDESPPDKELIAHQRAADRPWRLILIATWLPTWVFLLAHGMLAELAAPAIGIIPLTMGCFVSLAFLGGALRPHGAAIVCLDFLATILLVTALIMGFDSMLARWINYRDDEWGQRWIIHRVVEETILATFGCTGLLVNLVVHAYMVLRHVDWRGAVGCWTSRRTAHRCPHCTCALSSADRMASFRRTGDVEQAFRDSVEEARATSEPEEVDETARLA